MLRDIYLALYFVFGLCFFGSLLAMLVVDVSGLPPVLFDIAVCNAGFSFIFILILEIFEDCFW